MRPRDDHRICLYPKHHYRGNAPGFRHVAKVKKINKLRADKSKELIAEGDVALDPYEFDFLLLCNKICGASHYNMQMKIIVETPEEYAKWMAEQQTFAEVIQ